jgi:methyl-accepting chemotaxis protein
MGNATEQAASATVQSKANLTQLQSDIANIASATKKMSVSIKSVMENMLLASYDAERAAKETINGEEAVKTSMQGRGFAEVAAEVRTLAKRAQQSTQKISNVVDLLKTSSQKVFASIESGNYQAREAVTNAQQISAVWAKIVKSIKSVDDVTGMIATSTKEQSSVIQSINNNVASIDNQARETVVGTEQLSASSVQLSRIVYDMEQRIQVYKV